MSGFEIFLILLAFFLIRLIYKYLSQDFKNHKDRF